MLSLRPGLGSALGRGLAPVVGSLPIRRMAPEEGDDARLLRGQLLRAAPVGEDLDPGQEAGQFRTGGGGMRHVASGQQHRRHGAGAGEGAIDREDEIAAPHSPAEGVDGAAV